MDARDIFRDYPLTSDHEGSIVDTSNDTSLIQIGETSTMSKQVKSRKQKRVGYASVVNIRKILNIHRNGELPARLTREKLIQLGISSGDVYHVQNALFDLTFLDKEGYLTPLFESMARVSDDEYHEMLKKILRRVYSDVFDQISNPAEATQTQLYDAFEVYAFPRQHRKMIAVFKELCQQAGLMDETETPEVLNEQVTETHPITFQETSEHDEFYPVEGDSFMEEHPSTPQMNGSIPISNYAKADELGDFLTSLLQLPKSPGWTEGYREWWQQAVSSAMARLSQELKGQGGVKTMSP